MRRNLCLFALVAGYQPFGSFPVNSVVQPVLFSTDSVIPARQAVGVLRKCGWKCTSGRHILTLRHTLAGLLLKPLWRETQEVVADDAGHYNVLLGVRHFMACRPRSFGYGFRQAGLPSRLWLKVQLDEPTEQSPAAAPSPQVLKFAGRLPEGDLDIQDDSRKVTFALYPQSERRNGRLERGARGASAC